MVNDILTTPDHMAEAAGSRAEVDKFVYGSQFLSGSRTTPTSPALHETGNIPGGPPIAQTWANRTAKSSSSSSSSSLGPSRPSTPLGAAAGKAAAGSTAAACAPPARSPAPWSWSRVASLVRGGRAGGDSASSSCRVPAPAVQASSSQWSKATWPRTRLTRARPTLDQQNKESVFAGWQSLWLVDQGECSEG